MKNKFNTLVILGLCLIIIIGMVIWYYKLSRTNQGNFNNQQTQIQGLNGNPIVVNDFRSNSLKIANGFIPYYDSDYTIKFNDQNQDFEIIFTVSSLAQVRDIRTVAEQKLLFLLGVSNEIACKLDVKEIIPRTRAISLDQNEFSLSFCPSGIPLPN